MQKEIKSPKDDPEQEKMAETEWNEPSDCDFSDEDQDTTYVYKDWASI